ncbi:dimethylarginine dimethylaminohydrolase family protein [Solicola sp. PLA-1-18]|uniref:dimethylarginine dimethylaminohydrolase family protein n=1 Tax=Solicola sp. PLA-1-18 TaxID=3380532 RepID=UPI003B7EEFFC
MTTTLQWGRHYAMVEPDHFRIDYAINPFMDTADQPDVALARAEWEHLRDTLVGLGARVEVFEARQDSPDMVFAMNLGLAVTTPAGAPDRVVMSHMRFSERRNETITAAGSFAALGYTPTYVGRDGVGGLWESGDAFPHGGELLVGHGKRSDEVGLKGIAADLEVRVRGLRIVHPAMYHLDLAFCPLDDVHAMVCPEAFDADGAAAVLDRVAEPLVLTVDEALTFCANSVVVGRTVVMPACPPRVRAQLEAWDLEVVVVPMGELHKGGGSIRCMTNPLDIALGRDLEHIPGGLLDLG